jgi:hypothetical protein
MVGDRKDAIVRPDEAVDGERRQRRDDIRRACHGGAHYDVDVEAGKGGRAESCVDVHAGPFGFLLEGSDPGDVEREVIADIGTECGTQSVNGVVDGGFSGVEEYVDILAVPSRGEAG